MTVLYVVATDDGHTRVAASQRPVAEVAALRRSTSAPLRVAYAAAAPSGVRAVVAEVTRHLAARRVCPGWYDLDAAEVVATIERAMELAQVHLTPIDTAEMQNAGVVVPLPVRRRL